MHILDCTMCRLLWTTSYLVTRHLVHKFKPLRTNSRENILKTYTLLHDSAWVSASCPWINAKYGTHPWEMLWKKISQKHRCDPQLSGVGNRLEDHHVLTIFLHFCVSLYFSSESPKFSMPNEFVKVWRTQRDTSEGSPTNIREEKFSPKGSAFWFLETF